MMELADAAYDRLYAGTRAEFVASRAIAKNIGMLDPSEVIRQLDPSALTPLEFIDQLGEVVQPLVSQGVLRMYEHATPDSQGNMLGTADHDPEILIDGMVGLAVASVEDSATATLSIPSMAQTAALNIVRDPRSRRAIRNMALSPMVGALELPVADTHTGRVQQVDPRMYYDTVLGHLETPLRQKDNEGCPVARGRGELVETLFTTIGEVTVRSVQWPAGKQYYE